VASRTKLADLVTHFRWRDVRSVVRDFPALLSYRDERGRNWLHLCASVNVKKTKRSAAASVKTAGVLLEAGIDVNDPAFEEEDGFRATPLWFAIAFGENLPLAHFLLHEGSSPEHCMWAAVNRDSPASIRLLLDHGARLPQNREASLLTAAIAWNKFVAMRELLRLGVNPDFRDDSGMTALHYLLKKGADVKHIRTMIAAGARGDIPNAKGDTAIAILRRKRDPRHRRLADQLARR
jgi:ankyrin repeat protein